MVVKIVKTTDMSSEKPFGFYLLDKQTHENIAEESFETKSERLTAIHKLRVQLS